MTMPAHSHLKTPPISPPRAITSPLSPATSAQMRRRVSRSVCVMFIAVCALVPFRGPWNGPRQHRCDRLRSMGRCVYLRARVGGLRSGLDEAAPDRVPGRLDPVAHPELLEDVRAVTLDGLPADHERRGDLLAGVPLRDQLD